VHGHPGGCQSEQGARRHGRDGHDDEQGTGRLRAQALPGDEKGVAPQHDEDGAAEHCREVHPEAQARSRVVPHLGQGARERADLDPLDRVAGVGRVLDDEEEQHREDHPDRGGDGERGRPSPLLQAVGQRRGRSDRPELAQHTGDLGDHRRLLDAEPQGHQPQQAGEDHRVAHAEQNASREATGEILGEGEPELPDGHEPQADEHQPPRPEAVQEDAHGNLHRGIHTELDHGEGGELTGADAEALGRKDAGDAERGAVEDREPIDTEPDQPDDPGAASTDVVHLASQL